MGVTEMKPENALASLRDVVRDLLFPELKSMKMFIDPLRTEMQLGDEKPTQVIQNFSEKRWYAIGVRER